MMRRKARTTVKSNSDKRIEQLYNEALLNAKNGAVLNYKPKQQIAEKELTINSIKFTKKDVLEDAVRWQKEREKQRRNLSVPVSRLLPFNSTDGATRSHTVSRCGSDGEDIEHCGTSRAYSCTPSSGYFSMDDRNDTCMEDMLLVLPLRACDEDTPQNMSMNENKTKNARPLPPIYRTTAWANTIRYNGPSASIPSKGTSWADRELGPLEVGGEQLHIRSVSLKKEKLSLTERRTKLEQRTKRRTHATENNQK